MTVDIPFTKMVGTGNDFLIVDTVQHPFAVAQGGVLSRGEGHRALGPLKTAWPRVARAMCDRRYGVGADGLLVLERSRVASVRMRIFNPDGSEAEMCGNGARCVARYLHERSRRKNRVTINTKAGTLEALVAGERVAMHMPDPRRLRLSLQVDADRRTFRLASVDTGVPHAVAVIDRLDHVDVERIGRQLRFHQAFRPRGTNVDFIEVKRPDYLRIRTYERGVEAETLACGTGVAAAAVIHALRTKAARVPRPRPRRITVETKSGETLVVSLTVGNGRHRRQITNVTLEGAVRQICQGTFSWRTLPAPQREAARQAGKGSR